MDTKAPIATPAAERPGPAGSPPLRRQSAQLGEMLVRRGVLTRDQLDEALRVHQEKHAGRPLGEVLVELKLCTPADIQRALAAAVGLPFVTVTSRMVRPGAVSTLPREFCDEANLLPLSNTDGWLTVALADFNNLFLVEEIRRRSGLQVQVVAATAENIRQVREEVCRDRKMTGAGAKGSKDDFAGLEQLGLEDVTVVNAQTQQVEEDARDLEAQAGGSPTIRLVNHILKAAVEAGASDIHIEPQEHTFQIRYRIDGDLTCEALRPPARLLPAVVSRLKIMAGMDISERRLPQDGAITVMLANRPIELRVSTMATTFGEKVCIRVVDNSAGVRKLEELGFGPKLLRDFRRAIHAPNGIVLVTGPTGSGKSTTLYAAMAEMVDPAINISSIEDPVEFHLQGINQFQANAKTGFTFARALRSLLRQDPDVVMVGEIRDAETAKLATEAALTGHLVLSTLHTNDAPGAVPRLVNMGVEAYLVAASLRAVLAQRLVRRLCPHCRRRVPLRPAVRKLLAAGQGSALGQAATLPEMVYEGAGCAQCHQTGYAGRTGIYELLLTDEEMLQDIGRDLSLQSIRAKAQAAGFSTLVDDAITKLTEGLIAVPALYDILGCTEADAVALATAAPVTPAGKVGQGAALGQAA
jgi:type IV pilus assembly protein PilB